jgi:hypothetical protein
MKIKLHWAAVLAAGLTWGSACFAGSGFQFALYITVANTGAGDAVNWSYSNGPSVAAQRTAVAPESSSWSLQLAPSQAFDITSGTFSQPFSFMDRTRPGYFDIVTFIAPTHLLLDVRQAVSRGPVFEIYAAGSDDQQAVFVHSNGTAYTNPGAVPEPANAALLLGGLAVAGLLAKRRKPTLA